MKTIKRIFMNPGAVAILLIVASFGFGLVAHGQAQPPPNAPTTEGALQQILCNIVAYFFWIVILISVIMVLYAAFTYATAGADAEKTTRARRTITYAAVGIIVALIAYGFPAIISDFTNSGLSWTCASSY